MNCMKRFVAHLNDGSYMNIKADRIELIGDAITVYCDSDLVAFLDIGCVLTAQINSKENET